MLIFKVLKRLVNKLDLFSSIQLLRFDGDAETKTLTGGIFSLAIVLYIMSTFSSMILDTFNKIIITSTSSTDQDDEPAPIYLQTTNQASHFMMGLQLWHFDLTTGPRYIDVILRNSIMVNGMPGNQSVEYQLQPCTKDHWRELANIESIFQKVLMNTWLCMPLDIVPIIKGRYYSDVQSTLDVVVQTCKNETDPSRPCASPQQISAFMAQNSPFYFTPFFYNPLINPQNQNYLNIYLEDKYYIMFGPDAGMEMYIYNAAFSITTDESILPFGFTHQENGSMVTSVATNSYKMGNNTDVYCFISFFRDPTTIVISRSFQKVIDAFSYVGGLLGSFLLVLIFVNFYNQCSYEMRFASMYKPDKDCGTTPQKFNLGYYFLQALYGVFQIFKMKCQKWKAVRYFHKTREEMQRQLDVRYLFKKLHILQNAMMLLLTKSQLRGLMLQHEMTIEQAKKIRRMYDLRSKFKNIYRQKLKRFEEDSQKKQSSISKLGSQKIIDTGQKKQNYFMNAAIANQSLQVTKREENQTILYRKQDLPQVSSSSSGQSQSQQDKTQQLEKGILEDLNTLNDQSQTNNISATILQNLDPFVKKLYQLSSSTGSLNKKESMNYKQLEVQSFDLQQNIETFQVAKLTPSNLLKRKKRSSKLHQAKFEQKGNEERNHGFVMIQD